MFRAFMPRSLRAAPYDGSLSVTIAVGQKPCDLSSFRISFSVCALVPARLHQDVQDLTFAIDGTPKINALAVNLDEDFIEMPAHIRARVCAF